MTADQITFGVEFECLLPAALVRSGQIRVGTYTRGEPLPGFSGWVVKSDISVQPVSGADRATMTGVEIVSPVLSGPAGLVQAMAVATHLTDLGAKVNFTCGFHVHVGWREQQLAKLQNLVNLTSNLEPALFAATGTKLREVPPAGRTNYCNSIKVNYAGKDFTRPVMPDHNDRYHTLNLNNLLHGRFRAVEFRVFQGTLNAAKVCAYVRLVVAIVEKALSQGKRVPWDATQKARDGGKQNGREQMTRAFYRLGWNRGSTAEVFGFIGQHDQTGLLPDLESSKAVLKKLAAKYDAYGSGQQLPVE